MGEWGCQMGDEAKVQTGGANPLRLGSDNEKSSVRQGTPLSPTTGREPPRLLSLHPFLPHRHRQNGPLRAGSKAIAPMSSEVLP